MKWITNFFLENISIAYNNDVLVTDRAIALGKLAFMPALATGMIEYASGWYIDNRVFIGFMLYAISADAVLGAIVNYHKKTFSTKELFWGFIQKFMAVAFGYVTYEMIHQIVKDLDIGGIYFKAVVQLMVFLYPAGSISRSLYYITAGKFPPIGLMNRFKSFNKDLNLKHFDIKDNENETDTEDYTDTTTE